MIRFRAKSDTFSVMRDSLKKLTATAQVKQIHVPLFIRVSIKIVCGVQLKSGLRSLILNVLYTTIWQKLRTG